MNISILGMISDFAKERKLTVRGAYYKFDDSIPSAFYETVIDYFKTAQALYVDDPKLDGFYIELTNNYDVLFYFIGNNGKTKLIVREDGKYFGNLPSAKIVNESLFFENVKTLDDQRNKKIIDKLPNEFKNRFLKDSNQVVTLDQVFYNMGYNIISYMNYLEEEKKKSEELLKKEFEEQKDVEKIYFVEADSSTNSTKSTTHSSSYQPSRKNAEISIYDRNELLNSYSPSVEFEAVASNSVSTYYVKVFTIKEKCKLIMEPKEGNKYTKIVHLDNNELSKADLRKIVIDSLELSRSEITENKNISRHCHTTLEEYKKLLDYLIYEKDDGLNYSVRKRIDDASGCKKR